MALCPPEQAAEGGQCNSCKAPIFQPYLLSRLTEKAELDKLSRSNEHPTNFQISHCEGIISSAPLEFERYDAEISRLRAALERLESERAVIEDYSRLCRYALSPIRRLPSEILTEIFTYFLPEIPNWIGLSIMEQYASTQEQVDEELGRVANVDLLRISQVCPRWHQLIMGTPSLWSVIGLNLRLWTHAPSQARMAKVLISSLERGVDFPLNLGMKLRALNGNRSLMLLRILARYCHRWRELSITMDSAAQLKRLSVIKGNLPLLETLNIDVQGCVPESTAADLTRVFEVTPRLTKLRYCGPHAALSELPLEQLELFVYVDVLPQHLDSLISVMARLSNGSNCQIRVNMDDDNFAAAIDPPATSSNVSILSLCAAGAFDSDVARRLLSGFVARLTLPFLDGLRIICHQDQDVPLPWPHLDFLALSNRSSFYDHLTVLSLESVFITEAELLQTLSDLLSLQGIVISDHRVVDGQSEELVLVTNSLLQRLTRTSDPACLVPDLAFLECHSLLKFDDTVCRDFVLSRLKPRPKSEGPFDVKLHWYPKYYRRLDPVVVAQFRELQTQGELRFSISASSLFPSTHSD